MRGTAVRTEVVFENRVRFNWGYHDAATDARLKMVRDVVEFGPQTPRIVSEEHDLAYARGYRAGLKDAFAGKYAGNSDAAWFETVAVAPDTETFVKGGVR